LFLRPFDKNSQRIVSNSDAVDQQRGGIAYGGAVQDFRKDIEPSVVRSSTIHLTRIAPSVPLPEPHHLPSETYQHALLGAIAQVEDAPAIRAYQHLLRALARTAISENQPRYLVMQKPRLLAVCMQIAARTMVAEFARCVRTGDAFAEWPDMVELFPMVEQIGPRGGASPSSASTTTSKKADRVRVPKGYVLVSGDGLGVDLRVREHEEDEIGEELHSLTAAAKSKRKVVRVAMALDGRAFGTLESESGDDGHGHDSQEAESSESSSSSDEDKEDTGNGRSGEFSDE